MAENPEPGLSERREFDFTNGDKREHLPQSLRNCRVTDIFVEFLALTTDGITIDPNHNPKNHAVLKIDIDDPTGTYYGLRIAMDVDHDYKSDESAGGSSYQVGTLRVKLAQYSQASRSSVRTDRLQCLGSFTLDQILEAFERYRMSEFSFVTINNHFSGCRDWVTQAVSILCSEGMTNGKVVEIISQIKVEMDNVFDSLGMRYSLVPAGEPHAWPVDRGTFHVLRRYEAPHMPYVGSTRANELKQRFP